MFTHTHRAAAATTTHRCHVDVTHGVRGHEEEEEEEGGTMKEEKKKLLQVVNVLVEGNTKYGLSQPRWVLIYASKSNSLSHSSTRPPQTVHLPSP